MVFSKFTIQHIQHSRLIGIRSEIEALLRQPNEAGESYGTLKEQMIEDYYVIGHGCLAFDLRQDLVPQAIVTVDAARIAFNKK